MSLSESVLQSQIALNQNNLYRLHLWVEDCYEEMQVQVEHHKYYAGMNVDKEIVKRIKAAHFMLINSLKRQIAKYVKLQKALKAELKAVRQQKAMVRSFLIWNEEVAKYYEEIIKATQEADSKDNFATDEGVKVVWEDFIIR